MDASSSSRRARDGFPQLLMPRAASPPWPEKHVSDDVRLDDGLDDGTASPSITSVRKLVAEASRPCPCCGGYDAPDDRRIRAQMRPVVLEPASIRSWEVFLEALEAFLDCLPLSRPAHFGSSTRRASAERTAPGRRNGPSLSHYRAISKIASAPLGLSIAASISLSHVFSISMGVVPLY
jgi:hypothetical protein